MRTHIALVALSFTIAISAYGQESQPAATPQTDNQPPVASTTGAAATVYFYRYKQFVGSALAPSVYSDEGELGRMENGRFFRAKFTPGKHIFRSNDKQSGIESELKAGEEYYIRVELVPGAMKGHGRLVLVPTEQGAYEIKKLKPLDADKVKDREHVLAVASSR
jgi:hypothetical protein